MTNRKSHTRFRFAPISATWMTLNGHYALYCIKHAYFGAYHKNLNEDSLILSAAKMYRRDYSFGRHRPKVYADIRVGSLERGRQMTVELATTAICSAFAGYIFGTFRDKATIIIQRQRRLFTKLKYVTFNDCEWLFYVKFCFRACMCLELFSRLLKTIVRKQNRDRPVLLVANTQLEDSSFWQYIRFMRIFVGFSEKQAVVR